MIFYWSLIDNKSPQVSRILLNILADLLSEWPLIALQFFIPVSVTVLRSALIKIVIIINIILLFGKIFTPVSPQVSRILLNILADLLSKWPLLALLFFLPVPVTNLRSTPIKIGIIINIILLFGKFFYTSVSSSLQDSSKCSRWY